MRRVLRWRAGMACVPARPARHSYRATAPRPDLSRSPPRPAFGENWLPLFTAFLPQLSLALVTVQSFEELGSKGFVQHRLQAVHEAR
jgi:hypothetical protein